jgi:hypothetical protein
LRWETFVADILPLLSPIEFKLSSTLRPEYAARF